MKKLSGLITAAVLPLILGMPGAWGGAWELLDGALNENSAFATSMIVHDGVPVVALSDADALGNGGIHVRSFDGTTWNDVGTNPINVTGQYESADAPSLAVDGDGNLYAAWHQDHNDVPVTRQIFVTWNDGTGWADLGTNPLNEDPANAASAPRIAVDASGSVYAAWHEDNGAGVTQIFVKKINGADWEVVGAGPINDNPANSARRASVALDANGNPYVTWQEEDGDFPPVARVFVKWFDGTDWLAVGSDLPLNVSADHNAYAPRIAFNLGVPYVTWAEQDPAQELKTQIYVKSYDSTLNTWGFVGAPSSLNVSADQSAADPSIAFDPSGNPFVAWSEGTPAFGDAVFAKRFTGSDWELAASLSMGDEYMAETPGIVFDDLDGTAYINWLEEDAAYDYKVYVAKQAGDPPVTVVESFTATPCVSEVCITVGWETEKEPNNKGFHVWRLVDLPGQEYVRITETLIPAQGGEFTGAVYTLVDSDVVPGETYYYQLEDINLDDEGTLHGPVSAVAPDDEPPPIPWGEASTVKDPSGVSARVNTLGMLLVLPLAALFLLAGISRRRRARHDG